jgi:hypothetical protein
LPTRSAPTSAACATTAAAAHRRAQLHINPQHYQLWSWRTCQSETFIHPPATTTLSCCLAVDTSVPASPPDFTIGFQQLPTVDVQTLATTETRCQPQLLLPVDAPWCRYLHQHDRTGQWMILPGHNQ